MRNAGYLTLISRVMCSSLKVWGRLGGGCKWNFKPPPLTPPNLWGENLKFKHRSVFTNRILLFILIFFPLLFGCAGASKRSTNVSLEEKSHTSRSEQTQRIPIDKTRSQPVTHTEKESTKPKPAAPAIPEPTKAEERPVLTPQTLNNGRPVQKTPTPDLGRKLPKLIFSEELGLYTSPSAIYDIYFWNAYWFVRSEGIWFRSKSYQGPWEKIDSSELPERLKR